MPCCIYCLETKECTAFHKTEHVLPQSFGRFKDNFTLRQIVCDACNQYFGDELELALARDTVEGQSRFDYGLRDPSEFLSPGRNSRLVTKVMEGPFEGALAYRDYTDDTGELTLLPLPQVGFLMPESGKYQYFLLNEIPTEQDLLQRGLRPRDAGGILALGVDEDRLRSILAEKGIQFRSQAAGLSPEQAGDVLCELYVTIDKTIFRTIAKIALNYFAYWQGATLLLERPFDTIRRFIRYGEVPQHPVVAIEEKPILADEPVAGRRRLGHLITTNWADDGISIVAQVSLFNRMTYCVSLARDWTGTRPNLKRGHFFDVANHQILDLATR